MKNKVAIVKCDDYNQKNVDSAVREALNLIGGADKFIKKNNKVLLKVNLLMPSLPENGITTHPAVIKTLGKIVIENGGIPYVGDSSMWQTNKALDVCGVTHIQVRNPQTLVCGMNHMAPLFKMPIGIFSPRGEAASFMIRRGDSSVKPNC